MLKPISLGVDWSAAIPAIDAFDAQWPGASQYDWAGVYLHVVRHDSGRAMASYVGKHTASVVGRQQEHLSNIQAGQYNLFDRHAYPTYTRGQLGGPKASDIDEYLQITEVYFGRIAVRSIGSYSHWVAVVESLIQRSPTWLAAVDVILNHRLETPLYQMHDRFEIQHSGSAAALSLLGSTTVWDRASWTVT